MNGEKLLLKERMRKEVRIKKRRMGETLKRRQQDEVHNEEGE